MAVKHVTLRAWSDNSDVPKQDINQGDILSRTFIITLIDASGAPIDLTLSFVRVHFTKPDGHVCYIDASIINAPAGIFSVTLDSQCTAVPGMVKTIVQVTGPNGENMFCVGPNISVGAINVENSVVSSNEFTALTAALAQVQNIANKADLNADGKVIQDPASYGQANGGATLDAKGKVIQDPASYGKAGGAALISELPASPTLATLNPDGTLSSGSESGLLALSLKGGTTAGEFAYTVQQGQYTMIDKLCTAQIYIKISSIVQAAAGDLYLTGLPVGVGPIDRASITGRIAGADFHGVLNTITGLVYPANSVNTVNAAALKAADGFCCSISYLCEP